VRLYGSLIPSRSTFPTVAAFGCTWKTFWQLLGCVWSDFIKYEFEQAFQQVDCQCALAFFSSCLLARRVHLLSCIGTPEKRGKRSRTVFDERKAMCSLGLYLMPCHAAVSNVMGFMGRFQPCWDLQRRDT